MTIATDQTKHEEGDAEKALVNAIAPLRRVALRGEKISLPTNKQTRLPPRAFLLAMLGAVLLMDAIVPLRDLWFHEALLTQMGPWPIAPSLLLFPGWDVIPPVPSNTLTGTPDLALSWQALALLTSGFVTVFLAYLLALRYLPRLISRRFLMRSTLLLSLLFLLIPVVTSPDVYSYIAYARIGIMHGLNPLTTIPQAISTDVIYTYVSWVDQPSAYGPVWTLLTCFFQLITALCQLGNLLLAMLLLLRAWGLLIHVCSVALIWSMAGSLQRLTGTVSAEQRMRATLAFAWNPLLLLESCTNAHNDATLLFFLLLALWFLLRARIEPDTPTLPRWIYSLASHLTPGVRSRLLYLAPALLLACGICLKVNLILLAPGLFLYQWLQTTGQPAGQRLRQVGASLATCAGLILALYAPFWQGGELLHVLSVNPATSRTINSLADALTHLFHVLVTTPGSPLEAVGDASLAALMRPLSLGLFLVLYAGLCWFALRSPAFLRSIPGLVSWMAGVWLLYCSLGSTWFWPWYLVTFFGLVALLEAVPLSTLLPREQTPGRRAHLLQSIQGLLLHRGMIRMLVLNMLTLYGLTTWGPLHSFIPGLADYQWSYLGGFWAWLLPLLGLFFPAASEKARTHIHAPSSPLPISDGQLAPEDQRQ